MGVKLAACFVVMAMLMPAMSMASQVGDSDAGSSDMPTVQMGRTGLMPPEIPDSGTVPHEQPQWTSGGLVYIIIQSSLYASIPDSIDLLEYDIEHHRHAPYDVEIMSDSWTTHTQVKTALQNGYSAGMVGAILVGNIPTPWFRMLNPESWGADYWETFPIDLYYMDLDGTWGWGGGGSMADPFNTHTAGTGDLEPEIWVGRLHTGTLPSLGTEAGLIQGYIDRVDDYSLALVTRQDRALVYVDDDWYDYADQWSGDVGLVYDDRTLVKELVDTVKTDFMPRLAQDYEWLSLFAHTGVTYHALKNGAGWDYIDNYEIEAADCQALFYNLFCCGASNYSYDGYIQGYYAFANSGLVALGSAKTGSMLEFDDFYQPMSEGACIGESFKDWFIVNGETGAAEESRAWFYGMNIAGDPTLETGGYDELPEPPTGLTVEHWGPEFDYAATTETRYMRGLAGESSVNGLTAYSLGTANSATLGNWAPGNNMPIHLGMRIWKRSLAGLETEITSGSAVATVSRTATGSGYLAATWTPPAIEMTATDSIVIRVYGDTVYPPTSLRAEFTTEQLGADRLDSGQWTVQYWTRFASVAQGGSDWFWGTATYDNHISGFTHSVITSSRDPHRDNTLNWTASPSSDLAFYNIYRSDAEFGAYGLIDTLPTGICTYCDTDMGQADAVQWWYIVRAQDATGQEEQNTNAVQEPAEPFTYDRSLVGLSAPWVLLSYPIGATGSPGVVLDDSIYGDGMTTWTVAKTWDNLNKRWLTYRPGSTVNTFNNVDNKMGVWLQISSNGGDQMLTIGGQSGYPGTVTITLYTGWNLIGWPSATPMSASLIPFIDRVAEYQSAPPYILDRMPGQVTMSQGNGYWVHVTADCMFTVNP